MKLTAEIVKQHLRYDEETGLLWWVKRASGRRMDRPAGSWEAAGYNTIYLIGRMYKAHRLIWLMKTGYWPKGEIDHKDLNRANNLWNNLRDATHGQNQTNSKAYKNNTSGFKGVTWHKQHKKWYAQLQKDKKQVFLGLFSDPAEAHAAYLVAAKEHFGEFFNAG